LYEDPRDSYIGQKDAKVTIIEFFDYNCGFCKKSAGWVEKVIKTYPKDVKIIFKELPILDSRTKTSKIAAKAAIAANKQGKFAEIHFALMNERSISEDIGDNLIPGADEERLDSVLQDVLSKS